MIDRPVGRSEEISAPWAGIDRPLLVRAIAIVGAVVAIGLWHSTPVGYGVWFWVWAICVLAYVISFPGALQPQRPLPAAAWIALLVIVGLAAALRLPAIYAIPANISIDELLPGIEAAQIAAGLKPNVFHSLGWFSIPNLAFTPAAVVIAVTGTEPFYGLRLASFITGIAGIICTFLLARRLLNARAAMFASCFMALGFWHIHNSRTGFPFAQSSFAPPLVLYLLVRAQQDRSRIALAAAGVCCGFALELYFPVRILLLLCPLFLATEWISAKTRPRAMLSQAAIFTGGLFLVLGPLLVSVPWQTLVGHSRDILLTRPGILEELSHRYRVVGLWNVFRINLVEATRMFTSWADVAVLNRSPAGLMDDGTLIAMLAGILVATLEGGAAALLLLVWAALTFVFGVAFTDTPRASYRLAAAMPAFYILAGYAVDRVLFATASPRRWYRFTIRPALVLTLFAWIGWQNYHLFFVDYATNDGKEVPWPAALRFMAARCDGRHFYIVPKADPFAASETLNLFCTDHSTLEARDIPSGILTSRPVTFLIMGQQFAALTALNRCYPRAQVTQHRSANGLPLFASIDVDVDDLVAAHTSCPPSRPPVNDKQPT